jgi:predicted short-subunit dehydrogenase-like oxidoreductase (DUF2520 family)
MIESVRLIGAGRVGSAIAARLAERGVAVSLSGDSPSAPAGDIPRRGDSPFKSSGDSPPSGDSPSAARGDSPRSGDSPQVVLLCVPDGAIAEVARSVEPGPWIAHVSGATPLAALDPHWRRFGIHPLQTFTSRRGAEQLDGAWAAITAESNEARRVGFELAETLGLRPFELAADARPLYHAGAAIASNYLVTLHRIASELFVAAGAPPEALVPLMRRTIDNGFELTGPIERGDWATVESHRRAIRDARPDLEPLYDLLAEATAR